jgi:hypothetical protein
MSLRQMHRKRPDIVDLNSQNKNLDGMDFGSCGRSAGRVRTSGSGPLVGSHSIPK